MKADIHNRLCTQICFEIEAKVNNSKTGFEIATITVAFVTESFPCATGEVANL